MRAKNPLGNRDAPKEVTPNMPKKKACTPISSPLLGSNKRLRRKTESRARRTVKDDKLALEEDIAKDGKANAGIRLNAAKAGRAGSVNGSVVDVVARHNGLVGSDAEGDAGQNGAAGVGVTALSGVERRAPDLGVVGLDDSGGEVEEGGSGVGDGVDTGALEGGVADGVAVAGEFPETLALVDGHVGDGAVVLGVVDHAEAVGSGLALLQVRSEEGKGKGALGIGEKSLLWCRFDGVNTVKGQAKETVVGRVTDELRRDGLGELDGLATNSCLANLDNVRVDVTGGGRAIAVSDRPSVARLEFGGCRFTWVVDDVSIPLSSRLLGGENPTILD